MEVLSDFELHNLCKKEMYLREFTLENDVICRCGKFKYLDEILPKLRSKVSTVRNRKYIKENMPKHPTPCCMAVSKYYKLEVLILTY